MRKCPRVWVAHVCARPSYLGFRSDFTAPRSRSSARRKQSFFWLRNRPREPHAFLMNVQLVQLRAGGFLRCASGSRRLWSRFNENPSIRKQFDLGATKRWLFAARDYNPYDLIFELSPATKTPIGPEQPASYLNLCDLTCQKYSSLYNIAIAEITRAIVVLTCLCR